ncbi:MAG: rhodanese-like domain-containing protein [Candidatus Eremiobacteraeota bacterium]|nr:rhodanese-like domain-containing protein [Candidatus Eremiobacteraeota bacterium]
MKKMIAAAAALVLSAGLALADNFPDISQSDLQTAIKDKKVVLLDCNGSDSYKKGHIPGAIDFNAKEGEIAQVLPKDKDTMIVAYCGGPKCHAYEQGAKAVSKLGYTNVRHFSAGISGWQEAKLPVEK